MLSTKRIRVNFDDDDVVFRSTDAMSDTRVKNLYPFNFSPSAMYFITYQRLPLEHPGWEDCIAYGDLDSSIQSVMIENGIELRMVRQVWYWEGTRWYCGFHKGPYPAGFHYARFDLDNDEPFTEKLLEQFHRAALNYFQYFIINCYGNPHKEKAQVEESSV